MLITIFQRDRCYHATDRWDKKYIGTFHKLINNESCIEHIDRGFSSSFGEQIASSPGQYHWRFKLHKQGYSNCRCSTVLGIWKIKSCDLPPVNTWWTCTGKGGKWKYGYAYDLLTGYLINETGDNANGPQYGKKCEEGDIIEICLDFDALTLKLIINGEDMGISHNDIEDTEYRVALCTFYGKTMMEMLQ